MQKEKQWINCGHSVAIQLTQISQECPHEKRGRGWSRSNTHNISSTNCQFPGKTWNFRHFWGHRVYKMFSEAKNRLFDKKSVVFHRAESRWCQVCNLLCQFLTRSQFGRSPACEKWTEKNGKGEQKGRLEMWCSRVKNSMRKGLCARKQWVRKIVIWQSCWVRM